MFGLGVRLADYGLPGRYHFFKFVAMGELGAQKLLSRFMRGLGFRV